MANLNIAQQRLINQHIAQQSFNTPGNIVKWLGAVQAQDFAGAKWALGLRLIDNTNDDIDQAFADGKILRTHVLRPTWHFVTPEDILWLLALTAPRIHILNSSMYRNLGLDSDTLKQSMAVINKALQSGAHLTRDELQMILQNAGIAADNRLRLTYIMMNAELEGLICSGERRGKQFTYALVEERAPHAKALSRDEALAELAGRFFQSHGPATIQDFSKWSGLTIADARKGLDAVKSELVQINVAERIFWQSPVIQPLKSESPTANLLSIYDEYISGYKNYSDIGAAGIGAKLRALGNDLTYIILVNGQIVGTWKREIKRDAVEIKTNFFVQMTEIENQAIAGAARKYGEFLRLPVVLELNEIL